MEVIEGNVKECSVDEKIEGRRKETRVADPLCVRNKDEDKEDVVRLGNRKFTIL